ncbi:MAG: hypothetical protein K0R27_345 [Xanthobacteraceae bacterium]|jgi:hypothetical protein|nr:hypothetical protein [Xanthobacteraceae bacterium]
MSATNNIIEFPRPTGVEPTRPFVDGRCFCETWGLPPSAIATLIERQLLYVTSFDRNGQTFGGDLIAASFEQAQRVADSRGLGEQVIGKVCELLE